MTSRIDGHSFGDPAWFGERDVGWIADHGLDHVTVYVSAAEITRSDGGLDPEHLRVLDAALDWSEGRHLGVVLALADFPTEVTTANLDARVGFWRALAGHFATRGDGLRFDLGMPAPLASDTALFDQYNALASRAIHQQTPQRVVYLDALDPDHLDALTVPDEPSLAVTTTLPQHHPLVLFAEQHGVSSMPAVRFPGVVPDLAAVLGKDHWSAKLAGVAINGSLLDREAAKVEAFQRKHRPGLDVRFEWRYFTGWPYEASSEADATSVASFARAFDAATRRHGVGWTIYDYNSGCAIQRNGQPSVLFRALSTPA